MLSKENYDALNENYLYKKEPDSDPNELYVGYVPMTYWCRNWTFRVKKYNGSAMMVDTYWATADNGPFVTDENINDFKVIFDMTEVKMIPKECNDEYEEVFCVAIDSGGISYPKYFVRKDAKRSNKLLIAKKKEEIRYLKRDLEWAERELEELSK